MPGLPLCRGAQEVLTELWHATLFITEAHPWLLTTVFRFLHAWLLFPFRGRAAGIVLALSLSAAFPVGAPEGFRRDNAEAGTLTGVILAKLWFATNLWSTSLPLA